MDHQLSLVKQERVDDPRMLRYGGAEAKRFGHDPERFRHESEQRYASNESERFGNEAESFVNESERFVNESEEQRRARLDYTRSKVNVCHLLLFYDIRKKMLCLLSIACYLIIMPYELLVYDL